MFCNCYGGYSKLSYIANINFKKDNFAHDVIRYEMETFEPVQGLVLVDNEGRYEEVYEKLSDNLIKEYLEIRKRVGHENKLIKNSSIKKYFRNILPFQSNLTIREFLPTKCYEFLKILKDKFPNHKLAEAASFQLANLDVDNEELLMKIISNDSITSEYK